MRDGESGAKYIKVICVKKVKWEWFFYPFDFRMV